MAMTKCKECGKEVSSRAKTCPHCGVSDPATGPKEIIARIFGLAVIGFIAYAYFGGDSGADSKPEKAPEKPAISDAECMKDIQCWADKKLPEANYPCRKAVESLAKYSSKWTDSTFEFKFDHMRWADQSKGVIIFIGDKIQFQNGFGAYQNSIYECTYDPTSKAVLNATARAGRLSD